MSGTLSANSNISHYRIVSKLGTGGMGEVFLAEDSRLHRRVALKVLPESVAADLDRLRRFEREAFAASALNHPNILTIFEFGASGETHFLASEFVKGETLRDTLNQNDLTLSETLDIAVQIASALQAAHDAGIVHRDIKPENVMIREDGYVKVLDFGLAKLVERAPLEAEAETQVQTQAGMIMGTVAYMSPEQARGKAVDARTDIFSLGVVLYEMLARRQPFTGETVNHIIVAILEKEPPPVSQLIKNAPAKLERIIQKALAKNADARYTSAKDLLMDLKTLQKRLEFEAELERSQSPNKKTEAETQIFKVEILEETPNFPPNNLTRNLSPIIGREKEIAEIKKLLKREDVRLVTMTGIGGTGKTRLAQAVAQSLLTDFKDGVFFVELAAITNAELVASTIAQPLGVKEAGGKPILEVLKDYLRDRQILIVVDNFEQVTDAAPNIAELLAAANNLKILITSRVLLHLSKEREFVVPPLALPNDTAQVSLDELSNYEAIKLFIERAQNAKPNFVLREENARSVTEICRRLDGLPLAIELAAARVKILIPQAILTKLENRLKLLTGGARDLPARQQTMRGAVEWSYELLSEDEKRLFRRLAVFAGGFTIESAEAVVLSPRFSVPSSPEDKLKFELKAPTEGGTQNEIDVLDLITSLVDKSLLVSKEQADGESRFRMLEVVREYALESLETSGEAEAMRHSHAAYFLALGEEAEPHLNAAQSAEWLNRLEEEHDNLRAVLWWSWEQNTQIAARLAASLRSFWISHGHLKEGRKWFEEASKLGSNIPASVHLKLLIGAGNMAQFQGDYKTAQKMYEEGLAVSKKADDLRQVALSNRSLGAIAQRQGNFTAAREYVEESLAISRTLSDLFGIAASLNRLGDIANTEGNYATARPLIEESLAIYKQCGNKASVSNSLSNLGTVAFGEGDFVAARSHFAEALATARVLGLKIVISYALDGFAALAVERGESELAARLSGAAERLRESMGHDIDPAERRSRDAYLAELKTRLDEAAFAKLYEQGRKLKLDEVIALALAETGGETETDSDGKLQGKSTTETSEAQTAILTSATSNPQETPATVTKPDSQVSPDKSKTKRNWLLLGLLSLFILTAGFFAYRSFAPSRQIESIAVLPFVNESGNADIEYLSDGMTETLISSLSQIPKLNVKARSSVFRYKGKDTNAQTIGRELNVQAILAGRVIQRGQDLTLYVELVDAATENSLWKQTYNKTMTNLVALQNDIARDVADKLQVKLSGADEQKLAKIYTANAEAYQLYLKGRYYWYKFPAKEFEKSRDYFQQAIAVDPNYALAYSGLAVYYGFGAGNGFLPPTSENWLKSEEAVNKALALDDTLPEAYNALAGVTLYYYDDWARTERELRRAIELNPNYAEARSHYAVNLQDFGRSEEALAQMKRVVELEPLSVRFNRNLAVIFYQTREYDRAIEQYRKTLELDLNNAYTHELLGDAYEQKGMQKEAVAEWSKALRLADDNDSATMLERTYATSGFNAAVRALWQKKLEQFNEKVSHGEYVPAMNYALAYTRLADKEQAFAWLAKAEQERNRLIFDIKLDPIYDSLRSDSRFQDLLRRVGLPS